MNYRLSEIAAIVGGSVLGEDSSVGSIVTDSRSCKPASEALFVAMRGERHDSHRYIAQMAARGVKAFLVEHEVELPAGTGAVVVPNAIEALQCWATHHRANFRGCVVAVAGSNGKTILKEWLSQALPADCSLFRSPKSYNSQLGVALSLLMARGDEELVIIEAGISRPGEMERLERMIRPEVVLFTSLGEAHQENFSTLEQKAEEKLILARGARKILYHSRYELFARQINSHYADREIEDAARVVLPTELSGLVAENEAARINLQLTLAATRMLGYEASLQRIEPVAMRLELKEGINHSLLIDDAYNSDFNSLTIALDYLHGVAMGRPTTLILSDIEQSGLEPRELACRIAEAVDRASVGRFIGVGEGLCGASDLFTGNCAFYRTTEELLRNLSRDDFAGRVVLVKGSRRSRFERVIHALEQRSHTTTLEVDLDAMVHNLNYFRSQMGPTTRLVAMVKAASYGNGDFEVAQLLQHQGVDYLAVAFADEGILLRDRGITMPIVVLNADEGSFEQMIRHRLEPEIYNLRSLDYFEQALRRASELNYPIHIKLDTGMHRLGFVEEELEPLINHLQKSSLVRVASLFSHLNCADVAGAESYTREQIARFDRLSSRVADSLDYPVLRHTANSAAIERFPEARFDMCRLGLGLYGFGWQHNPELRPVATLRTRIVQLKHLPAGERVGYGGAGVLERDSVTATIPMGYADGLDRHLGCGRWSVLVKGQPAPIVGRVCMDSCMVDVTDIEAVKEGDEVVIFSPREGNDLETMARLLETIPYEIMTSISTRVKRIYRKE